MQETRRRSPIILGRSRLPLRNGSLGNVLVMVGAHMLDQMILPGEAVRPLARAIGHRAVLEDGIMNT